MMVKNENVISLVEYRVTKDLTEQLGEAIKSEIHNLDYQFAFRGTFRPRRRRKQKGKIIHFPNTGGVK